MDAWFREGTLRESLLSSLVPDQSDVRRGAKRGRRPLQSTLLAAALAAMDPTKTVNRKFDPPQQQRLAEDPTKGWMWCKPQARVFFLLLFSTMYANFALAGAHNRAAQLRT